MNLFQSVLENGVTLKVHVNQENEGPQTDHHCVNCQSGVLGQEIYLGPTLDLPLSASKV